MQRISIMCIASAMCLLCAQASFGAARPNVVIVISDDQGWGDLSASGNKDLSTPHIDSLARDGASLDRFYVCPVCSPTRAELLTGRYHLRSGVMSTSRGGERMDLGERTIAEAFQAAGYATGCFGKWHNGMQYPYHPRARGFDEFFGFCSGHWGHYFDWFFEHNGVYERTEGYATDVFTDRAIGFIEANRNKPFFCYVPLCTPHSPMQVPDRFWDKFADADLKMKYGNADAHTRAALAMVENIDWNVGRLLAKLESLELDDNTIVIYLSDNGPNGPRWNGGMKGRKGSTDEGGVRSACFIRWPAGIKRGATVEPITAAIDLLPTLTELCGIERVGDKPLDGMSIAPLLKGAEAEWPDRTIFSHWGGRVSARTQQYRLDHRGKLYDMIADPGQTRDVSKQHPDVTARLAKAVKRWRERVAPEAGPAERPFTVGHADWPLTELPARDAQFTEGIKRSSRHPNCSYLFDWKTTDQRITWNVDVLTPGRYEAIVYYTCPEGDVGSSVALTFGRSKTIGKIDAAHDPPVVGESDNRINRGESFVKAFKPLSLGVIELSAGKGTLSLGATKVPGSQVAEFRRLILKRVDAR